MAVDYKLFYVHINWPNKRRTHVKISKEFLPRNEASWANLYGHKIIFNRQPFMKRVYTPLHLNVTQSNQHDSCGHNNQRQRSRAGCMRKITLTSDKVTCFYNSFAILPRYLVNLPPKNYLLYPLPNKEIIIHAARI
jgi:hypothetical protein